MKNQQSTLQALTEIVFGFDSEANYLGDNEIEIIAHGCDNLDDLTEKLAKIKSGFEALFADASVSWEIMDEENCIVGPLKIEEKISSDIGEKFAKGYQDWINEGDDENGCECKGFQNTCEIFYFPGDFESELESITDFSNEFIKENKGVKSVTFQVTIEGQYNGSIGLIVIK